MDFPVLNHALAERWSESEAVIDFLMTNEPALVANAAPILLVQGSDDQLVPAESSQIVRDRACALGDTVRYRELPGESHDSILIAGMTEALQWTADRFAGLAATTDCTP